MSNGETAIQIDWLADEKMKLCERIEHSVDDDVDDSLKMKEWLAKYVRLEDSLSDGRARRVRVFAISTLTPPIGMTT